MASTYKAGIIGTGKPWKSEGSTGFGMAHSHAQAYVKTGKCDLVAVADINDENANAFAQQYGVPSVYTDYHEMLAKEQLDIVSICTWPHLHASLTVAVAEAGVKAIHCEKPMATTWGDAKRMHDECVQNSVQLTFNHQRRFLDPFQKAVGIVKSGEIGDLARLEAHCGDMYDWGTHWIDMLFFYNNETPVEWVLGQIDSRTERTVFGVPLENQGIGMFKYANGVRATIVTGQDADIGCANRIIGTKGIVEIGWAEPWLRVRCIGDADWRILETVEGIHDGAGIDRAVANLVDCLETGERPLLSSYNAIQTMEVICAIYESSRYRGRIEMPLQAEDNALLAMLKEGLVGPNRTS